MARKKPVTPFPDEEGGLEISAAMLKKIDVKKWWKEMTKWF
jgi:hypothetical protein